MTLTHYAHAGALILWLVAACDRTGPVDTSSGTQHGGGSPAGVGGAGGDAASGAAGGAAPTGMPQVRIDPDSFTAPLGSSVSVSWTSENTTSCSFRASGGIVIEGTSGQVDVDVDGIVRMSVMCEPFGPATTAVATIAPSCQGEVVLSEVRIEDSIVRDNNVVVTIPDDVCIVVTGDLNTMSADATIVSRVTSVGGTLFLFDPITNGQDFVALTQVGVLYPDYANGGLPPNRDVPGEYYSFPVLTTLELTVCRGERWDLRALVNSPVEGDADVFDVGPGSLGAFAMRYSERSTMPILLGEVAGVNGNVEIQMNTNLEHAIATTFVASLEPIGGEVIICGNKDDAPCPP